MKYIASCSFGKDSLAAIITRLEAGEPIDSVVYCRIMFNDTISAELPEHEDFIYNKAIPLLKSRYGLETHIVQSDKTYKDIFYSTFSKGRKIGRIYGFPYLMGAWCNRSLKMGPINRFKTAQGESKFIVGIAADEPKRIPRQVEKAILPLVHQYDSERRLWLGITEAQAMTICEKHDLLSPAYDGGCQRLGCWFCHNQRIGELKRLKNKHPELLRLLLELDKDSPVLFKPNCTLSALVERFEREDRYKILTIEDFLEEVKS